MEYYGVETEEDDAEVMVAWMEELTKAATQKWGENKHANLKERFYELLVKNGINLTGERVLLLEELKANVLAVGHKSYPGR